MRFLEKSSTSCNQQVVPQVDCAADSLSFFNTKLYEILELYIDNGSSGDKVSITLTGSAGNTVVTEDGDNLCSCNNYVQAVAYTV